VKQSHKTLLLWLLLIVMMIAIYQLVEPSDNPREVAFSQFVTDVRQGHVESVTVSPGAASSAIFEYVHVEADRRERCTTEGVITDEINRELLEHNVVVNYRANEGMSMTSVAIWSSIIPLVVLVALFFFFMRQMQASGGKAMSFGKSRARLLNESQNKVTFADVAGIDEAKDDCEEIIAFLKDPKKFQRLGGRIPKGVLLMGSPGTGKTLLARAIAGEAGVPFFSISGSDFVEMFVGVGASRVRDLFEQGKKHAPCIIFIDEIDAVGRNRGAGLGGGHDEREQTLNQLLVEMDGFEANEGVIIIAATNRADVLDSALLRPGRFDRRIMVPRPDINGRIGILQVHTKKTPLADDVDLEVLARGTPGMSGADLENLVNEAALLAARQDKDALAMADFELAKDKVLMGAERRSMVMTEEEKWNTAVHEAGHAVVMIANKDHDPIHKVTIIPRGRALGVTMPLPRGDVLGRSKDQFEAQIQSALGGRIAEEVFFGKLTTGASNDIRQLTDIARAMVCEYGMSKLGPLAYGSEEGSVFLGRDYNSRQADYSESTARQIDEEVRRIIDEQYVKVRELITSRRDGVEAIAKALMTRETLDAEELQMLLDGKELPEKHLLVIPTYAEKERQAKEKRKAASIFGGGPPKPAPTS
jgi:cell division protease FtsH